MSRPDRWKEERAARLEAHTSEIRRWWSRRVDALEDRLPRPVADVAERLREGDVLLFAGGLAFYCLVSLVPLLLLVAWVTGSILGEDRVESLAGRISDAAPGDADIDSFVQSVLEVGTGVGVIALLAAVWPATAFGGGLTRALDTVSVDEDPTMHGLRGRARALVVIVVLPLLVMGGFAALSLLTGLIDGGPIGTLIGWTVAIVVGAAVTWAAVIALHWWFGPADLSFRSLATGSAVAAAGMAIMTPGYFVYLAYGTNWEERVAGTGLAAVVLLCLWLYIANLLLLAGYCVAVSLEETSDESDDETSDRRGDDAMSSRPSHAGTN
ncbi:MAG: YihY/virulence factor BrkB family protein [Ilumatobacter sp.]|nr:MAG: YihY/virulence factor BrkB family protein [Ilumatobacter sp.]